MSSLNSDSYHPGVQSTHPPRCELGLGRLSSSPEWTPRKFEFAVEFSLSSAGVGGGLITRNRLLWEGASLVGAEREAR